MATLENLHEDLLALRHEVARLKAEMTLLPHRLTMLERQLTMEIGLMIGAGVGILLAMERLLKF